MTSKNSHEMVTVFKTWDLMLPGTTYQISSQILETHSISAISEQSHLPFPFPLKNHMGSILSRSLRPQPQEPQYIPFAFSSAPSFVLLSCVSRAVSILTFFCINNPGIYLHLFQSICRNLSEIFC